MKNPTIITGNETPSDTFITTKSALYSYILNVGNLYSSESARTKLRAFEKTIYFCSFGRCNYMDMELIKEELELTDELIYIFRLMYSLLCHHNNFLQFNSTTCDLDGFMDAQFSWNIPIDVIDIISSYIIAVSNCNPSHQSTPIHILFSTLANAVQQPTHTTSANNMSTSLDEHINSTWSQNYLGKNYFCLLEDLLNRYTRTDLHKDLLRSSVESLSFLLVECDTDPTTISNYVYLLLKKYSEQLSSIIVTHQSDSNKMNFKNLYNNHRVAYGVESEITSLLSYTESLFDITNKLHTYIKNTISDNHIVDSEYELAIYNTELFLDTCLFDYLKAVYLSIENCNKNFTSFFDDNKERNKFQENQLHYFDNRKMKHLEIFDTLLNNYKNNIELKLDKFFRLVKQSSASHPESYNTVTLEQTHISALEQEFYNAQKLLVNKIEVNFHKLLPVYEITQKADIHTLDIPYVFTEQDVINLIMTISHPCYLSTDYMIKRLHKSGFTFPLYRRDLLQFLFNYKQIFNGLIPFP